MKRILALVLVAIVFIGVLCSTLAKARAQEPPEDGEQPPGDYEHPPGDQEPPQGGQPPTENVQGGANGGQPFEIPLMAKLLVVAMAVVAVIAAIVYKIVVAGKPKEVL